MLQFITLIFPGILFAYVAEYLMKRRLDTHHFIFLSLFNILTINFIAMLLRDVFTVFLTSDDYKLVVESMENSIKQIVFSGIVGVPRSRRRNFLAIMPYNFKPLQGLSPETGRSRNPCFNSSR